MPHALLVEDDPETLDTIANLVELEGYTAARAQTLASAREQLQKNSPDVVLADLTLPDGDGFELLDEMAHHPATDVVVLSGNTAAATAVDALRRGATDYLTKPIDWERLRQILDTVAKRRALRDQIDELRGELRSSGRFGSLVGTCDAMKRVYDLLARVAPTDVSVFITGESGTGKEVVARTIHDLSTRCSGPFVAVNCGAISPSLIESELFGHRKGSFSGAVSDRVGHFEFASGGTIFLDEIGEMPADLQVKLLRVLETGRVTRVGSNEETTVDVRVLSATNRRPEDLISEELLREDLYYRLNVFPVALPPLRNRNEDIGLLADHFLAQLNRKSESNIALSTAAYKCLREHPWPGNIRELRNVMQRAFVLADEEIRPSDIPFDDFGDDVVEGDEVRIRVGSSIAEAEKQLILATLDHLDGDKKRAAEVLGISVKTLYTRLSVYNAKE